ncbi:DUF3265 domain-containing protein [Vibrio parahaemolyticus]|nr:DUF3265 domain-containing protein [Vibrio parahaemolyticus]MDG3395832.1 DUF3265 domain-containing protein [Vibrio parahaemolyticus]TBT02433.1 DUF3265 domain-containing protein [Vibrio parahaemolyticus]TBT69685.1 DUF3265 domain-containing protein [Vibrio parahaemolyticus]
MTNNLRGIPNAWHFLVLLQVKCLWRNALGWVVALLTP